MSTVANHLVGHDPLSPDKPPFRVPNEVLARIMPKEIKHETVEFMWENDLYRVTVVDTHGSFDTTAKETFEECDAYIEETKLRIDLILFVIRKGRFTAAERELFSFIMAKFPKNRGIPGYPQDILSISALVITECELDDTTKRERLVQEFEVDPSTREIANQMGMGIYPVGFPPVKHMLPVFQQAYIPQMVQDRDMLRELIVRRVNKRGEQYCSFYMPCLQD